MGHSRQLSRSHSGDWWPGGEQHIYEAIWVNLIFGDARLRARVALALSEIMVVSNIALIRTPTHSPSGWTRSTRTRLAPIARCCDVTLQPAMGYYLNMLGNDKEDPATGRMPNENYAREVLQLFSIGLVQLNDDGTPSAMLQGKRSRPTTRPWCRALPKCLLAGALAATTRPSRQVSIRRKKTGHWRWPIGPSHHSTGPKQLLNGVAPAGQTRKRPR